MTRVRIDKSGLGRDIYITGHCANDCLLYTSDAADEL